MKDEELLNFKIIKEFFKNPKLSDEDLMEIV